MTKKNWSATSEDGASISVTATAQTHELPAKAKASTDVLVYNPGPETVHIRVGPSTLSPATLQSIPVLPGSLAPFSSGRMTHISCIATGNQSIIVFCGEGE